MESECLVRTTPVFDRTKALTQWTMTDSMFLTETTFIMGFLGSVPPDRR
jgi:hypothetical protein